MFHRCVITVIGVLALGTSAAAGPIKLGESGSPFEIGELRASGVLDKDVLRALFFRGAGSRSAPKTCGDCLGSNSSLTPLDGDENRSYRALFPFSSRRLYRAPTGPGTAAPVGGRSSRPGSRPDLVTDAPDVQNPNGPPPTGVVTPPGDPPTSVPEPATLVLLGSGLASAWIVRRRKRSGRAAW